MLDGRAGAGCFIWWLPSLARQVGSDEDEFHGKISPASITALTDFKSCLMPERRIQDVRQQREARRFRDSEHEVIPAK